VVNIALATLITLSVLALAMAGYYNLVIRDHAIDSASKLARYGSLSGEQYLLKRLDVALPQLARFEVDQYRGPLLSQVRVSYSIPGLGMVPGTTGVIQVAAATERL